MTVLAQKNPFRIFENIETEEEDICTSAEACLAQSC
jgi:hypothetical protein